MGYKCEGGYQVWIPRIGYIYEGTVPMSPDHGSTIQRSNATRQAPSCAPNENDIWTYDTSIYTSNIGRKRRQWGQQQGEWSANSAAASTGETHHSIARRYRPRA